MFKRFLSLSKKSSDFFLQLDEDQSNQETDGKTAVAAKLAQQAKTVVSAATASKTEPKQKTKTQQKESPDLTQEPSVVKAPEPSQAVDRVEQLIVNAVFAKNRSKTEAVESGFATDYLISKPAPNRRPGASLNKFKEMTRKMKVSNK